ncbi:XdhC family protein, partial [Microbacterium sp.]|uniref:XdhC family protein n=1 Tax=Microbacterium sp. TaxID=51671 RepID=UPI003C7834FD
VGAMGARSTVAHRLRMLRETGLDEVTLSRLHSPLGLDLGGASPDETALSVLAEIVASRHGGSGIPLRELDGPLHARSDRREHVLSPNAHDIRANSVGSRREHALSTAETDAGASCSTGALDPTPADAHEGFRA